MDNKLIFILLVISVVIISACSSSSYSKEEIDKLAQCLSESGVVMYGSITCSVCAREKRLFGDSFEFMDEVECHPKGPNPQTDLCLEKEIKKTPTWILEVDGKDIKRTEGFKTFEELAEFSGCPAPIKEA